MTNKRRNGVIEMEETMKIIIECVFSTKHDKVERLNKLDNIRKLLYSEFESHHDINFNPFERIEKISLKVIDIANYDGKDSSLTRE